MAALPNNVRATCRAGGALLFDTATWHTAFPCTGSAPRRTAIIGYQAQRKRDGVAAATPAFGPSNQAVGELEEAGLLQRPALRQVLGLEAR